MVMPHYPCGGCRPVPGLAAGVWPFGPAAFFDILIPALGRGHRQMETKMTSQSPSRRVAPTSEVGVVGRPCQDLPANTTRKRSSMSPTGALALLNLDPGLLVAPACPANLSRHSESTADLSAVAPAKAEARRRRTCRAEVPSAGRRRMDRIAPLCTALFHLRKSLKINFLTASSRIFPLWWNAQTGSRRIQPI